MSRVGDGYFQQGAFPVAQLVKNPPAVWKTWIPGLGRSPGEGKGYSLQYSGLNSVDCTVHGVTKSQQQLSNFHFPREKETAFNPQTKARKGKELEFHQTNLCFYSFPLS